VVEHSNSQCAPLRTSKSVKTGKLSIKGGARYVKASPSQIMFAVYQDLSRTFSGTWVSVESYVQEGPIPLNHFSSTPEPAMPDTSGAPKQASEDTPPQQTRPGAELHLRERHDFTWALVGNHGLRAGWAALIFIGLYYTLSLVLGTIAVTVDPALADAGFSPSVLFITESIPLAAILGAGLFIARIERRPIADFNLSDTRGIRHCLTGALAGFVALSALVGMLALGGWVQFGRRGLAGTQAIKFALFWAAAYLVVGLFEEGSFRCYLQATLARGINYWWALAAVVGVCLLIQLQSHPNGNGGVYLIAALGLVPCWVLHRMRVESSSFWQAAWATSTAFGANHTGNPGETSIGIFAAALIGFIFCVSVWLTGSAWWAIGCHTAWDWAQTFFYGTANSGIGAQSDRFTTITSGSPLWSGGTDGPEGSLLVIPASLLLLIFLLVFHRRRKPVALAVPTLERAAN
jgi:membrane protease YdiL (CAAX protease family)